MTRMWIALPAAAIYATLLVVLRRQTRRNRAATTQGDTQLRVKALYDKGHPTLCVVQMSERVARELGEL